jgi:hypothetical protein
MQLVLHSRFIVRESVYCIAEPSLVDNNILSITITLGVMTLVFAILAIVYAITATVLLTVTL